ncbi:MAG: MFS transporter [Candidatus Dormibacteraeota bacterium]|nr:MFS transporter [Candidatus Dormibacteraeota bacterium]
MSEKAAGSLRSGLLNQPGSVWATAFAAAVAFMGIGLVDPILPSIARGLNASPWQVEMLFTSYIVVMAGAMFLTGMIATRFGAKNTMLAGLLLVIVFSALSGLSGSIAMLAGMRGGWGLATRFSSPPPSPSSWVRRPAAWATRSRSTRRRSASESRADRCWARCSAP